MLSIQNIKVAYGNHEVLRGARLELKPHTIHGILGMNGAGKTTFFEALYGRVPRHAGNCTLDGHPLQASQVAYLQTNSFFYPLLTGAEHLRLCAHNNPGFHIDRWNRLFQLPLSQPIDTYSTGMKQKLALLSVIASERQVLVLDEPFNGIDLESSEVLYQVLALLREKGHYLLLSSHILETLTNTCDAISYLQNGVFSHTFRKEAYPQLKEKIRMSVGEQVRGAIDALRGEL